MKCWNDSENIFIKQFSRTVMWSNVFSLLIVSIFTCHNDAHHCSVTILREKLARFGEFLANAVCQLVTKCCSTIKYSFNAPVACVSKRPSRPHFENWDLLCHFDLCASGGLGFLTVSKENVLFQAEFLFYNHVTTWEIVTIAGSLFS